MALRKMLGSITEPAVVGLMRQIETQSKETLAAWAATEVRTHMLPLVTEGSDDPRPAAAIGAVEACLRGERTLKELKPCLADARKASQALTATPVQQAAARAIATACAVLNTPTGALGFTFYFAAATAYARAGLTAAQAVYDALATEELTRLLDSLRAVSVPDEPNPVQVDWGC